MREYEPAVKVGNWWQRAVDELVAIGSPARAWQRWHFRRMTCDDTYRESVMLAMRAAGYKDGATTRKTPFTLNRGDADSVIAGKREDQVARSRDLEQTDPLDGGLVQTFKLNVVGTGIGLQAATGDEEVDERLNAVWAERKDLLFPQERIPYEEAQGVTLQSLLVDGEILHKAARAGAGDPVWFELIETDRLATPIDMLREQTEGKITDGVERDPKTGIPRTYWILKAHPGSTHSAALKHKANFLQVPADQVRHLRQVKRPGQTRALPHGAAVIQDLRDLDLLMLAALKRSQIAACLAAFIKSPANTDAILGETAKAYGKVLEQKIEPGMILKLFPEEEIQTLIPNFPFPELVPLVVMLARRIGAAWGVSWQVVVKDFGDCTYSSARTNLLETRPMYVWLQKMLVRNVLTWHWTTVLEDARLRGDPRLRGVTDEQIAAVHHLPPGWDWVDPQKQAAAVGFRLATGLSNLEIESGAWQGFDWRAVIRQRLKEEKFERDERVKMGLPEEATTDPAERALRYAQTLMQMGADDDGNEAQARPALAGAGSLADGSG